MKCEVNAMSDSPYKKVRTGPHTTVYAQDLAWSKAHGDKPVPKGKVVHHKNGNTYDNAPSNLEAVTISENKKASDKAIARKKK